MAGYDGYRMSNNAVAAYDSGEKPYTKWTKQAILEEIKSLEDIPFDMKLLKKVRLNELRTLVLKYASWHHTSSYYNSTDFYCLDENRLAKLTNEEILQIVEQSKKEKESQSSKPKEVEEKWKCAFLEWSGSRKHPTAKTCVEIGIVKGNYFYREDGSKKKTDAKGFRFMSKITDEI